MFLIRLTIVWWDADSLLHFVVFKKFNYNCGRHVIPDDFLYLDITLTPCPTQTRQKYGMLFKSVNAARYPFAFISSVDSRKTAGEPTKTSNKLKKDLSM